VNFQWLQNDRYFSQNRLFLAEIAAILQTAQNQTLFPACIYRPGKKRLISADNIMTFGI